MTRGTGKTPPDTSTQRFASSADWEAWLTEHHESSSGLWLQLAKKASGTPSVTYAEALEVALMFGWIDGQKRPLDAQWWLQRFTPRGAKSIWSKINREKVAALTERGVMRPAGVAAVEAAKADGRWAAAYDSQRTATVPEDLAAALAKDPKAMAFFATLNSVNRYAILFRLQSAKKAETRARRLAQFVEMLSRNEKLYP